jgi:hypothetical protein
MQMPRHNLAFRHRDTNEGPGKLLVDESHGLKKGAVGRPGQTLVYGITSQILLL